MTSETYHRRIVDYMSHEVRSYSASELETLTSRQAVRTAVTRGTVIRLFAGIYVANEHQDSLMARAHAAIEWAGKGAALAGASALFLWGGLSELPNQIHVVVPHGTGLRPPPWLRLTRTLHPFRTATWRGLPVVTADYALVKAFGLIPANLRTSVVYHCVNQGIVHPQALSETLSATPRVRSRQALKTVVDAALAGAESYLEQHGAEVVFACPELGRLLRQHRLRVAGESFRCDFYDAPSRTAIELDGAAYHQDLAARERDIHRDAMLAAIGILTVRFSYRNITSQPDWCRASLIEIIKSRSASTKS